MTICPFEHDFADHAKWRGLSDAAFRYGVRLVCWARHSSSSTGFIPSRIAADAAGTKRRAARLLRELVEAGTDLPEHEVGILEVVDGGYRVHDFERLWMLGDVELREATEAETKAHQTRQARRAAGAAGGRRSASVRREANGTAQPKQTRLGLEATTKQSTEAKPEANSEAKPPSPPDPPIPQKTYPTESTRPKDQTGVPRVLGFGERSLVYLRDEFGARLEHGPAEAWPEVREVLRVWGEVWRPVTLRGGLKNPSLRAILGRAGDGCSVDEITGAIRGSKLDEHIATHTQFQELQTVLRDVAQVEKFNRLQTAPKPPRKRTGPGPATPVREDSNPWGKAEVIR